MHYQKLIKIFFLCLTLLIVFALVACDAHSVQQSGTFAQPVGSSSPFLGDGSPKGPGSVALTATALSSPVTTIC